MGYVDEPDGSMRPILAAEYSLLAMKEAGIERCVIVVNDAKTEILKYFGDGQAVAKVPDSAADLLAHLFHQRFCPDENVPDRKKAYVATAPFADWRALGPAGRGRALRSRRSLARYVGEAV